MSFVSPVRDTYWRGIGFFICLCLWPQTVTADDSSLLSKISPLIAINNNASVLELHPSLINKGEAFSPILSQVRNYPPSVKNSMSDQDLFSMALGARFQISEWLGVGAACTVPFTLEETAGKEDLSIEAMVTMQF
ncbi:MAG: hypothetical protein ABFS09_01725 [Thermodesulfobacteriota bacterium]